MAPVPLVHTQLVVPPRVRNYVRRACLRNLGFSILCSRATFVVAPAGYGKTVWVSSLLDEPGWPLTAWLGLDRHDSEPSFLLYHLIHAIRKVLPKFGAISLRTMNSLEDAGRDWLIAAGALIEEIPRDMEMVLVLDDCHLVEKNAAARGILQELVVRLPAGVHLVLISRNDPPVSHPDGKVLTVRSDQLVFSAEEARELLSLLGLPLAKEDVARIHARAEGWAVGLRLLGMLLRESGDLTKASVALKRKEADLCAYLSNELLAYLPRGLDTFLLGASLLPYLEPELCNSALECEGSDARIELLHSYGLLSRTGGEKATWRLHHLVGEFLAEKVIGLHTPDYVAAVRRRAAAFLEATGDIDRALELATAGEDWSAAVTYLRVHSDRHFLESGRLDALHSWLGRIPPEFVDSDHWLLFFQGMSILHDQPEQALTTLSRAAGAAAGKGDLKCQLRALLAMVAVYTFSNDVPKIKETARRIPVVASLLKSSWSRGVVLVGALGQAAWGENLRQGVWLSRLTGKIALDPQSQMGYLVFSSIIQFRLGNLAVAGDLVHKVLADPYVREDERWTGRACTIYADVCVRAGDHQQLEEICGEMLRLGHKYHDPRLAGFAHRHLAQLHLWRGRSEEAREEFELAGHAFMQANHVFHAYVTDLDLFRLRQEAGESPYDLLAETEYVLEKLKAFAGEPDLDDYALSVAGIIALEAGELALARRRFEEVRRKSKRKGARQLLAGAQLFLARIALLQGDDGAADSYLREALGSAESHKWEFFWDWHPETVYCLCRRALLQGIHPQWAARLLRRWFGERIRREAGALLACPEDNVRNTVAALLQEMVQKTGVSVIHVNCLGGFRVFVSGMEVQSSQWKTKRAASLFQYLSIDRRQYLKEEIIEKLWPEADPRLGDVNLRTALTHVRKALGLGEQAAEAVVLKRGLVYLSPDIEVRTDFELFAATAQRALERGPDVPVTADLLEEAAELYRGDFLPDNPHDDWTAGPRAGLAQLYLQVLLRLIESCRRRGKADQALSACRRYLALEPADEPVCRTAMELLWQGGQKQRALALYQELVTKLAHDYGTVPAAATEILGDKIRGI